eukprot:8728404-Karenia_brevis.AAC.1
MTKHSDQFETWTGDPYGSSNVAQCLPDLARSLIEDQNNSIALLTATIESMRNDIGAINNHVQYVSGGQSASSRSSRHRSTNG